MRSCSSYFSRERAATAKATIGKIPRTCGDSRLNLEWKQRSHPLSSAGAWKAAAQPGNSVQGGVMRIGQHSAKVIFFASADAWIQAKPLIKLMELKNISTTFRRAQPENESKLRDLINATGRVLCEKLVSQGGTQEFTPKKTISAPGIAHVGGMSSSGNGGYRQFVLFRMHVAC